MNTKLKFQKIDFIMLMLICLMGYLYFSNPSQKVRLDFVIRGISYLRSII
jgi:hypothetical protein